jgi:hypothetical protein
MSIQPEDLAKRLLRSEWEHLSHHERTVIAKVLERIRLRRDIHVMRRWGSAFDPYPFIFLNLILSMVAAIQAPVIMMSQNRQSVVDRMAAANDYEVNLRAELGVRALIDRLDELQRTHQEQLELLRRIAVSTTGDLPPAP